MAVFAIYAARVLDTRVRCIHSPFIEAVQFVKSDNSKLTVYQCNTVREFFKPIALTTSQQKRIVQIEQLNMLSELLPKNTSKKFLQITAPQPFEARIDGPVLRLGEGVAAATSFETNLIYFLLLKKGHELETWTLSLYLTSHQIQHHWIYDLVTSKQFCLQEPRLFKCEDSNQISPFAMATSFAFLLKAKEKSLGLKERFEFLRNLIDHGINIPKFNSLAQLQNSFDQIFKLKSFSDPLPFGVELLDVSQKSLTQLQHFSWQVPIVIFEKNKMTIWPTLAVLPRQKLFFDHLVLLTCAIPKLEKAPAERVTVIRHCEGETEVNWQNILLSKLPKPNDSKETRDEAPLKPDRAFPHHKVSRL